MKDPLFYIGGLLRFAFTANPMLYLGVVLSLVSVGVELAAVSSLLPLSALALGQPIPPSPPVSVLAYLHIAPTFKSLVGLLVVLLALRLLVHLASQGLSLHYGRKLLAQLASRAFLNIVEGSSFREIEKKSIGSFISLAGDESFRASTIVISIVQFIGIAALAFLYFAAIAFYSPLTALGVVVFLFVSGLMLLGAFRRSQMLGHIQIEQSQSAGSLFLDALNGLRTVRALSAEDYVTKTYRTRMHEYVWTLFRIDFINVLSRILPALLLLAGVFVLAVMIPTDQDSQPLQATFVTSLILLMRFFPATGQTLALLMRIVADTKSARDVLALVNGPHPTALGIGPPNTPGRVNTIEIRDLTFSHPGRAVFSGFSVELTRGKSYALIGPSGSGKSSLFDVLLGFYPFERGDIVVNGTSIKNISPGWIRSRAILVGQQTVIFNDTIENNICFGRPTPRDQIEAACRLACIHDAIAELPNGYQTLLSYQGTNLSGGQRQRIGLARALLRQPEVLFLDEVTAGLDGETRNQVVENLLREFRSRMIVFSTHDRELASKVDEVIGISPLEQSDAGVLAQEQV